jgi:hypothetical protein
MTMRLWPRSRTDQNPARVLAGFCLRGSLPSLCVIPVVDILANLILGEPVAFLNLALKLIPLTVDGG